MNQEVKTINGYNIKDEKAIRTYDTVALMQADSKLSEGQHVKTRGYYQINDGGGCEYYITTQSDSDIQEILSNGLYATLIEDKKDIINVLQVGCYLDGETDNSTILNKVIDYANANLKDIYFPIGNYLINEDLHNINGCISLFGDISGEGQRENKATIIDNRTSNNYLFHFVGVNGIKGGCVKYLNFVDNKINTNKCIRTDDGLNYLGSIENCNFLDFAVGVEINGSHGFVLDKCAFVRCGGSNENSDDFAIKIIDTTDVSINNSCIDHTRYQLFVDGPSMVYVTNTHFELSMRNIVKGREPIYCYTGNYGYISFTNCSFINLSYKEWINSAGYTISNVIYMIYATYASFVNCMLSCGRGSGGSISEYNKQAKFINLYYGSIDNCKIKSPAYLTPAFNLTQSTFINNHIQCDIEDSDFNMGKDKRIVNSANILIENNFMQYLIPTQDPQTYPSNYPCLSPVFNKPCNIETNLRNIFFTERIPYADIQNVNTLRLQSNDMLFGAYHLKIYSIGEPYLFYDGYIRINTNKTIQQINVNQKSFGYNNKVIIYSDDNSNDVYIQILEPEQKTNIIIFEMENLKGNTNLLLYYDKNMTTELSYTNKLDLSL